MRIPFPLLWRYLLFGYTKVFTLSVFSFIAILLVSRFKEIARFAALSESAHTTLLFVLYQIPLILPIALPISAFLAAILLFDRLSRSFELTAMRSSGVSLSLILTPLILFALFCSFCNFSCASTIAPYCRRAAKEFLYYETSKSPLVLLRRQNLIKTKKSFVKMDESSSDTRLHNFFLITTRGTLSLIHAKELWMDGEKMKGEEIAIVSHFVSKEKEGFDSLLIENQKEMSADGSTFSASLKKKRPKLDAAGLEFSLLRLQSLEKGKKGRKAIVEMARRVSVSLAILSFTLLGSIFAIQPGRDLRRKNLWIASGLALFLMLSYLLGKEFKGAPFLAFFVLLAPHPLIWICSGWQLRKINRGAV